jgi:hypothetical protein
MTVNIAAYFGALLYLGIMEYDKGGRSLKKVSAEGMQGK